MTYIRVYGHEGEDGEWVRPIPKPDDKFTYQWNSEWADDPTKPILKITKSSLGSFKWCKKQYEYSYLDRRPQDQTEAMYKGTVLHNSYEDFYNNVDIKKAEDMSFFEVKDYFQSLFPIDDYMDLSDTIATFEAQRFIDAKDAGTLEHFTPAGNELLLDAHILIPRNAHPKYPLNRDYIVHLQGIIDRIYTEEGKCIPFEFKTGVWKDTKKTMMRREMSFYKMLMDASEDWDTEVTHWGWYYPASNYVCVEEVNKRSESTMKKALAEIIYAYEQDEFTPSYFHKKCVWCSFAGICPAAIDANLNSGSDWL